MLSAVTRVAEIGIRDQKEFESLVEYLKQKEYLPVVRNMITGIFDEAGLSAPGQKTVAQMVEAKALPRYLRGPQAYTGELFFKNSFAFALLPSDSDTLHVSMVGPRRDEGPIKTFCEHIKDGVSKRFDGRRVRGMKFEWRPVRLVARGEARLELMRYGFSLEDFTDEDSEGAMVELNSTDPTYSPTEAESSALMVHTEVRQFVLRLAKLRKMPEQEVETETKSSVVKQLLDNALIAEEYLLQCKHNGQTICVVPDKDRIAQEPLASLRCNTCDRSFPNERLQTIYTLTGEGKRLVDGSLWMTIWMTIWMTDLLEKFGISRETIKWALEASGEDLDMMVEDMDSRVFFELKDREFGLGDAYPFVNRVNRYGGTIGVVATTDRVSADAKRFFEEEVQRRDGAAKIRFLEGPEEIQRGIVDLFEDLSQRQVRRRLVQPFSASLGLDLWPFVKQWLNIQTSESTKAAEIVNFEVIVNEETN